MRPLTRIHQVELTSRCNLRCKYCPHPKLRREKEDMDDRTLVHTLMHLAYYTAQGSQREVSITGLGEALMHPKFMEFVEAIRKTVGRTCFMNFSTNGLLFTEEVAKFCQEQQIGVFVSLHRPEKAAPAINLARRYGVLAGSNTAFATSSFNWAGELDWEVTAPPIVCEYLLGGWGVVLADGRVSTCCIDAHGQNIIGSVTDEPGSLTTRAFPLCEGCHMQVPEVVRCQSVNEPSSKVA